MISNILKAPLSREIKKEYDRLMNAAASVPISSRNVKMMEGTGGEVIPIARNKFTFERVKAPGLNDRKRVHIDLILTRLRSFNRGDFHAAQM